MKRNFSLLLFLASLSLLVFAACGKENEENTSNLEKEKIKVIATLFPSYDFARQIGRDKVEVKLLLPPGIEAHSFEPTPKDISAINKADIFIFTGGAMEPWSLDIIAGIDRKKTIVVDAGKGIKLLSISGEAEDAEELPEEKEHGEEEHHHNHAGKDPHFWMDFDNAKKMVDNIASALAEKDPAGKDFYLKNADDYKAKLDSMDEDYRSSLDKRRPRTIIYAGHFALGYMAKRYGLKLIFPYKGSSPNSEPTPKRIAYLIKTMKETGSKYVYHEELLEPRAAKVIAEQTGAKILLLHGAHNVSKKEIKDGTTYLDIMRTNLDNLKTGLGEEGKNEL
jgi:zinc transport system substrate-binding protein